MRVHEDTPDKDMQLTPVYRIGVKVCGKEKEVVELADN